jgi:hypothetical protein
MRRALSSPETRFFVALAVTFAVLVGAWEVVLRRHGSATVDVPIDSPDIAAETTHGQRWLIFGNCLMMTGISPRRLNEQLGGGGDRIVTNIAAHEQSPLAFFEYLRRSGEYPDVIIANVSSWLNGTNFDQESELVTKADPLGLAKPHDGEAAAPQAATHDGQHAYQKDTGAGMGRFQHSAEAALSQWGSKHVRAFGHRYHLFDFGLFLGTLARTGDLDNALYQLGMQSWFKVKGSETDGFGYLGLDIAYREDWPQGLDLMAERSLQRLRLSRLLTPRYWALLEDDVRDFQSHGTQVLLVRMPEHPKIRAFNDETYDIPGRLKGIEDRTGAPVLDLSRLGPADGVHLFDAVHPDRASSDVIARELAAWLRTRVTSEGAAGHRRTGGG